MSRWKAWIYLPFSPIAWGIAGAALLILTALGASPLRPGVLTSDLTPTGGIVVLVASSIFNIVLFWRQVRPRYLTAATTRRAFATTLLILTVLVTSSAVVSRKTALAAGWVRPTVLKAGESPAEEPTYIEYAASGQLLLTAMILFTAFWTSPDSVETAINARRALVDRLSNALTKKDDAVEKAPIVSALESLLKVDILSWRTKEDEVLFGEWRKAAKELLQRITPLASSDLLSQARADVKLALNKFQKTKTTIS